MVVYAWPSTGDLGVQKIAKSNRGGGAIEGYGARVGGGRRAVVPAERHVGTDHIGAGDQREAESVNAGARDGLGCTDAGDGPSAVGGGVQRKGVIWCPATFELELVAASKDQVRTFPSAPKVPS